MDPKILFLIGLVVGGMVGAVAMAIVAGGSWGDVEDILAERPAPAGALLALPVIDMGNHFDDSDKLVGADLGTDARGKILDALRIGRVACEWAGMLVEAKRVADAMDIVRDRFGLRPGDQWDRDMAEVGRALLQTLETNASHGALKSWAPLNCPSEVVADLLNLVDELSAASAPQGVQADSEVWPIVNVTVNEQGKITEAKLYSPGLPAGNHDVYPVRVPYMDEHTEAWLACANALRIARPNNDAFGENGIEWALRTIRELAAAPSPDGKAEQAEAPSLEATHGVGVEDVPHG